ncbi:hypothetical protein ACFQL4_16275 [Halosimplex aquaticum]
MEHPVVAERVGVGGVAVAGALGAGWRLQTRSTPAARRTAIQSARASPWPAALCQPGLHAP